MHAVVKSAAPRRRPRTGGYARGDEARERVINAAVHIFADEGYVRASTRRIAAAARVNLPALQYYFGSKEGLHRACGELISEQFALRLGVELSHAKAIIAKGDRVEAAEALCDLLDKLLSSSLSAEYSPKWSRFLARLQVDNDSPAFSVVNEGVNAPLSRLCAGLACLAMGRTRGDNEVRLQVMFFLKLLGSLSSCNDSAMANIGRKMSQEAYEAMVRRSFRQLVMASIASQSSQLTD
jgi:AcrR family transcriptional regulator